MIFLQRLCFKKILVYKGAYQDTAYKKKQID